MRVDPTFSDDNWISLGGSDGTVYACASAEVVNGTAHVFFREPNVKAETWHRIERTTDFQAWEDVGFNYAGETGGIDFTDNSAPEDKAFYRAAPLDQ